jgi:hypothetical protein
MNTMTPEDVDKIAAAYREAGKRCVRTVVENIFDWALQGPMDGARIAVTGYGNNSGSDST